MRRDRGLAPPPGARTLWFTPWRYGEEQALWRAFILRVLHAVDPRATPETDLVADKASAAEIATRLDRLADSLYRPVGWQEAGRLVADWTRLLPEAGKAAGMLLSTFLPGGDALRHAIEALWGERGRETEIPTAVAALHREVRRGYQAQLVSREQFAAGFEELPARQSRGGDRSLRRQAARHPRRGFP